MGSERWFCNAFGGTGKILTTIAAAALIVALSVVTSRAGDILSQPADSLTVTNSVTRLLPQAAPPPGGEQSWLSSLHISGYGSQTFGVWQNPPALRQYTLSRNNLAVARSLLQIDENYRLDKHNTFFMRQWFVYEPPYQFDSGNIPLWEAAQAVPGFPTTGVPGKSLIPRSYGSFMNEFYNNYQVRDAWWEYKLGPLTMFTGNQIAVWGQSVAFRVGDVINPANTCWAFGFANLEQSREAQWMLHPILTLPEWGQFTSNFLELVVLPGFQPRWWPEQTKDPVNGKPTILTAGRTDPCQPAAHHGPSARFDVAYPMNSIFPYDAPLGPPPYDGGGAIKHNNPQFHTLIVQPTAHEFWVCKQFAGEIQRGFNPAPKRLQNTVPCDLSLSKNQGDYSVIGDTTLLNFGLIHVPGMQPRNWNEGVRFHTLYGATEWTALYFYTPTHGGVTGQVIWEHPFTNLWRVDYPTINEVGMTVDRPIPAPASIAEHFPAIFRGEALYTNHDEFNDASPLAATAIRFSDTMKYMLALDLDQAYAPWLTSTGNLTANLEWEQETILDNSKDTSSTAFNSHYLKNNVNVLGSITTSWWWGDFSPNFTMIFNPKGRTMAIFPSITLNPPWTKQYFMKLQAIEVLGGDIGAFQTTGVFKGQSYLLAQFQYNFDLM
jgi:hypothetical protein